MRISTIRHAYEIRHRTGVNLDGAIVSNEVILYADTGAYIALGAARLLKSSVYCCGVYTTPNTQISGYLVFTNTLNGSAMRGMGVLQCRFAWKSHLDLLAERLGITLLDIRRKNMFTTQGILPNGQQIDSTAARETLKHAITLFRTSVPIFFAPPKNAESAWQPRSIPMIPAVFQVPHPFL